MKIAWLNEHLLYFNGGIRYIYEVAKRLNSSNTMQVRIIVGGSVSNSNRDLFSSANISMYTFSNITTNSIKYWLLYPYYLIRNSKRLKMMLTEYKTVISTSPTTNILAMLAKIKPIIVVFELNPWLYNKEYIKGLSLLKKLVVSIGKPVIEPIDRAAHRNAKTVICHSKYVQSEIKRVYGVDSIVVPVGVDSTFFNKRSRTSLEASKTTSASDFTQDAGKTLISKPSKESLWDIYSKYSILLHLPGYQTPMKGTRYAIKAMQWVVKEVPKALLLITTTRADDTKPIAELKKLAIELGINKHIQFISNTPDEDMPILYSLAKVILQPSLDENAHYPAIEGGCCECPTVGFQGTHENEDIIEGTTGYIVDKYDSKAMAEAAIDIINDKYLQGYLGRNARQFMINKFSWDRCINEYKELIKVQ